MKTFNFYMAIICSLFLLITTSCDQENIGEKYTVANEGVSFSGPSTSITVPPNQMSVDYRIIRGNTNGRLELPLTMTYDKDIFTLPSSVVFEDGSGATIMTIPLEKTVLGVAYTIELAFDSVVAAEFGKFETTINVMRDYNWERIGKGLWTDGLVCAIFSASALTYEVDVEKAVEADGMFRMVNPYGFGVYDYTAEDEVLRDPHYIVIDATNPNQVVINRTGLGIDWGYGEFFAGSRANMYGSYANDVITFPAGTIGVGMPNWSGENYGAASKICILNMGESHDYSAEIEYTGRYTDASNNEYAMANVKLGADVAYAKVAVVSGNLTEAILDGIVDGSIESEEISANGAVSLQIPGPGRYTYVVVTFDSEDEAQDYASVSFTYLGSTTTTYPIEDFYGDYIMTGFDAWDDTEVNMSVTIAEGDMPNTLVITGITYAASVTATFPVKGYMSIAPQALANYGPYDIALETITPDWDISSKAAMIFTRLESGTLVLASDSYAMGYLLWSDAVDAYVDGYYDLVFTPKSGVSPSPTFKKSADHSKLTPKSGEFSKKFIPKQGKISGSVSAISNKVTSKLLISNITPIPLK